MRELARFPNLFCKLSGMVTEADWQKWKAADMTPYLNIALDCFGPNRLMIGSDWPVCTLSASYAQTMNVVLDYLGKCPQDVQDAVLSQNAQRFWKLKVQ